MMPLTAISGMARFGALMTVASLTAFLARQT
jgi:hypothetical protein